MSRNRGAATMNDSTNGNECKKRPIGDIRFDRYQNFFDNSSKLDKRRRSGYQRLEYITH